MVKLQIGANTIYLTKQEQDFLFQLLDNNYDHIENSPTFNAIHNWLIDIGCRPDVLKKTPEEMQKEVADYFDSISKKVEKKETTPLKEIWSYTDSKLNQKAPMVEDPWGDVRKSWSNLSNNSEGEIKQKVEDLYKEWSDVYEGDDYKALRKLLGELLNGDNEKGYYVAL